jgi:alkanesulfonate monooxygenase SsuD/methylene tetrahydromethanopterin reductase-like flavin-dependent oxidoreductase (luciferase family)
VGIQLGMFGFGELASYSDASVRSSSSTQKLGEFKELVKATEAVGLDVFGVGEHHREEFAISAPPVVLAALAEHTQRVRLASVLTVLASDDPVRVLEQFTTLDALSGGRAELYVGRDAFPEAFTLFGHRLADDDELLREKLRLLLLLQRTSKVTWSGRWRAGLRDASVTPTPSPVLPIGVTAGRNRGPIELAARLGVPLTLLAQTGRWRSYAPFARLYRQGFDASAGGARQRHVTILVPAHIAETSERASVQAGRFYGPAHAEPAPGDGDVLGGPMVVGNPAAVTEQLLQLHSILKPQRILLELGRGNMPISDVIRAVELLGDQVASVMRHELAGDDAT